MWRRRDVRAEPSLSTILTAILPHPAIECAKVSGSSRRCCSPAGAPFERARSEDDHLVDRRLAESIRSYSETKGVSLKFRDGAHFAALDGGAVTLALTTALDHPVLGQVVDGVKTADVDAAAKAVEASGGGIVKGPYDDAHERRAVVYDNKGNGLVFYSPLAR